MITKRHRFHGLGSLRFVLGKGEIVRAQHCSLKYAVNNKRSTYRVAVVVSRKVHKNAVVRNRIRRRLYEVFREQAYAIEKPYDLVFTVYNEQFAAMEQKDLEATIKGLLKKAQIIPN